MKWHKHFTTRLNDFEERNRERFSALRERTELALRAVDMAAAKADEAMNGRLAGMNEFRAEMGDQARRFALTEVVNGKTLALENRIKQLEEADIRRSAELRGMHRVYIIVMGIMGFVISSLALYAYFK